MKKPNLVFMYGEDSFSLLQELERWKQAFMQKHGGDINLEELDGKSSLEQIAGSISAMPFLAEKRFVVLKDFLAQRKADEKKDLIPILEKLSDTTVLVIAERNSPDKRSALFKHLSKSATLKRFEKPQGAEISTWILRQVNRHGGNMDSRTAHYLAQAVGDNLWQLQNEVQKLCLYAQDKSITPAMVDELVSGSIEQSIFAMTDQLARRNSAAALKTLRELHAQGQQGPYLFAMITRQFRLMLEMKSLNEQGLSPQVIAKKMGAHPFVVSKTLQQCRNFSHKQLKEALAQLLEIDRRLKTGRLHLRTQEEDHYLLALERVIVTL